MDTLSYKDDIKTIKCTLCDYKDDPKYEEAVVKFIYNAPMKIFLKCHLIVKPNKLAKYYNKDYPDCVRKIKRTRSYEFYNHLLWSNMNDLELVKICTKHRGVDFINILIKMPDTLNSDVLEYLLTMSTKKIKSDKHREIIERAEPQRLLNEKLIKSLQNENLEEVKELIVLGANCDIIDAGHLPENEKIIKFLIPDHVKILPGRKMSRSVLLLVAKYSKKMIGYNAMSFYSNANEFDLDCVKEIHKLRHIYSPVVYFPASSPIYHALYLNKIEIAEYYYRSKFDMGVTMVYFEIDPDKFTDEARDWIESKIGRFTKSAA